MVRKAALAAILLSVLAATARADDSAITPKERAAALKADTRAAAIESVKMLLKDPSSAQFKAIKREKPFAYCGWVNAKNSYGGYEGFSVFFSTDKATVILSPDLSSPALC